MVEILKDVGQHIGWYNLPNGHYEATIDDEGTVIITTVLDNVESTYKVTLSQSRWDRLVSWIEWQRKNRVITN